MFRVSTEGDWSTWIEFCLNGVIDQCTDSIKRCTLFQECRQRYFDNADHNARTHSIIDGLFNLPYVSVVDLSKKLDVSYNTAQSDIDRLVEIGVLERLHDFRPKTYYASELFAIAYEENIDDLIDTEQS